MSYPSLDPDTAALIRRQIADITPEQWQRMSDELEQRLRPLRQMLDESTRLTAKDLDIRITI